MATTGSAASSIQTEKISCPFRNACRQYRPLHRGPKGNDLHYRGYDIADLAAHCEFEEVAYLLVTHGKLPNAMNLLPTSRS
jgi:citrate synthase